MNEATLNNLESQARKRIAAQTKHVPGVSMCLVSPHELLELVEAHRDLQKLEEIVATTPPLLEGGSEVL